MATAAELLAARASGMTTGDNTLVIDNDLRTIQIPSSITNLGVENDDDVLRLHFRMPRYLGIIDLSTFTVRINYLNAKGESDVYIVDDLSIVGDSLAFSWLVGPTATKYKGNTKFNVCMRIVDADAYVQKEYNTTIATLPVLEGLECEESVIEYYSDILEQWRRQLFGIGDTEEAKLLAKSAEEQQNIADKGAEVLASIPEDFTTTYNLALEGARSKADAIIRSAEGEEINLTDSSNDLISELKLYGRATQIATTGKNLFDIETALLDQRRASTPVSEYYAVGSNAICIETNSYDNGRAYMYLNLEAGQYVISADVDVASSWNFSVKDYEANVELVNQTSTTDGHIGHRFMIESPALIGFCFMSVVTGGPPTLARNIQLELGTDETQYEKYSGGFASPSPDWPQEICGVTDPSVVIEGKNLIDLNKSGSACGVSEKVANGLVSFSGTANASGGRNAFKRSSEITLTPGTYTFSMVVPSGTAPQNCLSRSDNGNIVANGDGTFIITEPTTIYLGFNYITDRVYNAKNVSVQLERGDIATNHVPYTPSQTLTYTLPSPLYAGELDCITGDLTYANLVEAPTSGWTVSKSSSGWAEGIENTNGVTIAFHYHLGAEKDNYYPKTVCTHFPAANSWSEIVSGTTEMVYRGNTSANGLASETIRIKRSRLMNYGLPVTPDATAMVNAFTRWLAAQKDAGTPVKMVGEISETEQVESYLPRTNATGTVIRNDKRANMSVKYNGDFQRYVHEISSDILEEAITQDKIQAAVDAWLNIHYSHAEGVSF